MNDVSFAPHSWALDSIIREEERYWHFDPSRGGQDYIAVGNIRDRVGTHWIDAVQFAREMAQTIKSKSVLDVPEGSDCEIIRTAAQIRAMGYEEISTSHHKAYSDIFPEIFGPIFDACSIHDPEGSIIHQSPGQFIPWHYDSCACYAIKFKVPDRSKISRFLVFLEDWSWGHYVLIGNSVVHQWKSGDMITWPYHMRHLTANAGMAPKLTMQITGLAEVPVREGYDRWAEGPSPGIELSLMPPPAPLHPANPDHA
ncbi:hypothetical protein BH10PSE13_BH10PSE13_10170 [soil metagenome]